MTTTILQPPLLQVPVGLLFLDSISAFVSLALKLIAHVPAEPESTPDSVKNPSTIDDEEEGLPSPPMDEVLPIFDTQTDQIELSQVHVVPGLEKKLLVSLFSMCSKCFCFRWFPVFCYHVKFFDGMDDDGSEFESANSIYLFCL